ncbi:hypothetical protein B0T25DRAFT_511663 [Lasiosphaeria hispida]|uniref:BZIP domain-containing protein n=1 Tax=Lasiosphaeria hispida TaxID=260671 RepID=A0AAJ0H7Q7_9PEZI|nr:hypothetical protein B0T25DRAFT_511663 [Lasiosphaeria hispida]
MASWSSVHTPTALKFENSPTESLLSTPSEMYPSLFGTDAVTPSALNPVDMMTPRSYDDDDEHDMSALADMTPAPETPGADDQGSEKKPVKKRKSWGQVLPEPKTNLPPRKRAKTEDEKEQRRVERVLRNRRAAQSSRERKRQEVEGLERRNKELENLLRQVTTTNQVLMEELRKVGRTPGVMARAPASSFDALRPSPTFSHELFSSHDGNSMPANQTGSLEQLLTTIPTNTTVNPASLSPTLAPVPEDEHEDEDERDEQQTDATTLSDVTTTSKTDVSPDATQHPAEMLWLDLQCRSAEAPPSAWLEASQKQLHPALALLLPLQILLISTTTMVSLCQRPLTQIAMSLKAGFSLPPTQAILRTIIWLVTTPSHSRRTSTSTSLSLTTMSLPETSSIRSTNPTTARSQTRRSSTLRLKSLRKILTCSPNLARPLRDATMEALRLASTEEYAVDRVSEDGASAKATFDGKAQRGQPRGGRADWLVGAKLPSKEVLLTLAWVLKVHERKQEPRQVDAPSKLGRPSVPQTKTTPTLTDSKTNTLRILSKRRKEEEHREFPDGVGLKRRRVE